MLMMMGGWMMMSLNMVRIPGFCHLPHFIRPKLPPQMWLQSCFRRESNVMFLKKDQHNQPRQTDPPQTEKRKECTNQKTSHITPKYKRKLMKEIDLR